jgi:protein MpaA
MRASLPLKCISSPLHAGVLSHQPDKIQHLLEPLLELVRKSDYLVGGSAGEFVINKKVFQIPRFIFMGPAGGGDTIRLGIFATFHGDEPDGAAALVKFLRELEMEPQLAGGYHIYTYPVCNPTGFIARTRNNLSGDDLTGHFWRGSSQPEIYYLEREMGVLRFQGVLSLQTEKDTGSFGVKTGSAILNRALSGPAIQAADKFCSETALETDALRGTSGTHSRNFLTDTDELDPKPFELHIGIPGQASELCKITGTVGALKSILETYRSHMSIAQNL